VKYNKHICYLVNVIVELDKTIGLSKEDSLAR